MASKADGPGSGGGEGASRLSSDMAGSSLRFRNLADFVPHA